MRRKLLIAISLVALLAVAGQAAAATVLRTRGYAGIRRAVATQPPTAPDPAVLAPSGTRPDVLVDAAGTAHVVWNEDGGEAADITHYCRVPRGARACEVEHRLVPELTNNVPGNDPRFSDDNDGPAVLAVNDQVVVLSHRYPYVVPKPGADRSEDDNTVYLWTSDDGGQTFVGPGVVGTRNIDGDAVVFGTPDAPQIATVTGVVTGGTTVSALSPGRFTFGGALIGPGDLIDGRLAVVAGRPVAAFEGIGGGIRLRTWSGQGDPNDASTWGPDQGFPGADPEIANAGGRLLLLSDEAFGSGRLVLRDTAGGPVSPVNPAGSAGNAAALIGAPDGTATALWQGAQESGGAGVWRRSRLVPGVTPAGAPGLVTTVSPAFMAADAASDGGGVVTMEDQRRILLAAFGSRAPTGLPGLGSRPGGGSLGPDVVVDCQRVRFGPVEALIEEGCLLNAARGSAKVTQGTLRLNGLDIVPDTGVQILVDPRARTIDTTGSVRVLLRAPGVPDITLFRGELHLKLSAARVGQPLFSFPSSLFRPDVLGFPVAGGIEVRLTERGVRIPISLELPAAFGGVSGRVEILADNARGLVLDSLDLRADAVPLGPVMLRHLEVQYRASGGTTVGDCLRPPTSGATAQANEWAGVFELELPPPGAGPALCGSIRFGDGRFRAATFRIDLPYPGIVLFPGVSLTSLGGGLSLDPLEISATASIGVIPASANAAVVRLDGRLDLRLDAPVTLRGQAVTTVVGLAVGSGAFTISADGYAALRLVSGLTLGPFSMDATIAGFLDGSRREFAISGGANVTVAGATFEGGQIVVSTKGVALCGPVGMVPRGGGYRWGSDAITDVDVWLVDCDADEYEVADTRAQEQAREAAVAEAPFDVAPGTRAVTVRVRGEGGIPQAEVIGPGGAPVTPSATFSDPATGALYLGLTAPPAGTWRVRALPGSPGIAEVSTARSVQPARILSARVTGRGAARTLAYRASIAEGQSISFAERGAAGTRVIGTAASGSRRLRFAPAPGPGGRRSIVALVSQAGLVRSESVVAGYTAPAPPALRPPSRLRARRAGARVVATWRPGRGASAQLASIRRGGALETRLLGRGARRLVVTGAPAGTRVTISVASLGPGGRRSAGARVAVR